MTMPAAARDSVDDGLVRRETAAPVGPNFEYVMSDGSVDNYGDIVEPRGWDLSHFDGNPIALFNHDAKFPIGTWEKVRVEGGRLVGRLKLAQEGTSERINEIISLVRQGVLKAVSVGFRSLERAPMESGGIRFVKQRLLECSLVSVPANANAVQIAKAMNISAETFSLVFGKPAAADDEVVRRSTGKPAATPPARKAGKMSPLAQRIELAQARLVALKDELTTHIDGMGEEPDDAALTATEELNTRVASAEKSLSTLMDAEARLAATAAPANDNRAHANDNKPVVDPRRPFAVPAKKVEPVDYIYRALTVAALARITQQPIPVIQKNYYGDDEPTKEVTNLVVQRAASAPATTSTTGWAVELVQTAFTGFINTLMPDSIYPRLSALGQRYSFGRAGRITIPGRAATPTIAGSFVLEGNPIPVRQAAFTSVSLTPKKMAVISTMTREITEHSTPAIEGLIRQAISEDTAVAIDTVLIDATAVSTTRPAGLRNGVSTLTATSGGTITALVADIKQLVGVLVAVNSLRSPVWIMNPAQVLSISMIQDASGGFPFKEEILAGRLAGYPVIASTTMTAGMVILLDAADFASVTGDDPRFDVSDTATLHMEDTTPLAIGTAGSPNTVAAPVRSLFQTDSLAIRMILPMNWALVRTGTLAWTSSVTW